MVGAGGGGGEESFVFSCLEFKIGYVIGETVV